MYGDKHVGFVLTGDIHTLAKWHEKVVVAHQLHVEPLLPFQAFGEQLCDGQHHIFFPLTLGTDRAGVLTAMSWVDYDNDVAFGVSLIRRCFTWNHCRVRGLFGIHQIQHQAVALAILRRQQKAVQ
jgi:hypothetical protein